MKQLQIIFLLSAMVFMITCKDPITSKSTLFVITILQLFLILEYSARFTCNETANKSLVALTVDVNSIHIHFPDNNETIKMNMLDLKNFNKTMAFCEESTDGTNITQKLSLHIFSDHMLSIEFFGNSSAYHLEKVVYTKRHLNLTQQTFKVTKPSLHLWHNTEFKTDVQGYKCGQTEFKLTETSSQPAVKDSPANKNNRTVEIKLNEFMFVALQNGTSTSEITRMRCRVKPKNSNIPYYVGGGLLGLAAVVVVVYFVMRKRSNSKMEKEDE